MRARKGAVWVRLLGVMLVSACPKTEYRDATEVTIVVDSDTELKQALARIHVDVLDEDGESRSSAHDFELDDTTMWPLSFGVYQPPGGADWFRLVTRGYDADASLLVENKAIIPFGKGRTDREIRLSNACAGKFCTGDDQTCNPRSGACETVTRSPTGVEGDDGGPKTPEGSGTEDAGLDGGGAAADGGRDAGETDGGDADLPIVTAPVPPSVAGVVTFGGRRTNGTMSVCDDGFEQGARICTADGKFCVTGGLSP